MAGVPLLGPDPDEPLAGPRDDLVVSVRAVGGAQVLTVEGTVDIRTAARLSEAVTEVMARRPARVVIDLTAVDFLASAGLHVLLVAQHAAGEHTLLRVVATGPGLRSLSLTALDEVLAVYPTLSDATGS